MHPRLKKKNQKNQKKEVPWVLWKGSTWLLAGGTAVAMAILTSALIRDHQNYVFGTARPDLNKDLKKVLRTYDAGSTCNPVVPYLCRADEHDGGQGKQGEGDKQARAPLERRRISKISARAIWETTEEEELLVVVLGERERARERDRQKKRTEEMSWLRSAISKAAEVGNKTNLSRTAKTFADAVLQQAAGSAKIVQDRLVRPLPLLSFFGK